MSNAQCTMPEPKGQGPTADSQQDPRWQAAVERIGAGNKRISRAAAFYGGGQSEIRNQKSEIPDGASLASGTAGSALRPFPARTPGTPQARYAAEAMLDNTKGPSRIIPRELRLVVNDCSTHCRTCDRFSRNDGGCAGVVSIDPDGPACHSEHMAAVQKALGHRP